MLYWGKMKSLSPKIGYSRSEFGAIFQIYAKCVYKGIFKDFSFTDINGQYYISFREEAGQNPLITIEKRRLGPDSNLFIATTPGPRGTLLQVARSEKILHFIEQLEKAIASLADNKKNSKSKQKH